MKTNLIAVSALFIAATAQAHVEPGTYVGKTADGATCEMKSVRDYFENNMPHPLNERIVLEISGEEYTVGHPSVVDFEKSLASFNHDVFQAVKATRTGAKALQVEMNHAEGQEGPVAYTLVDHAWKANTRTKLECKGLQLQR